jgi:hypothetical protein
MEEVTPMCRGSDILHFRSHSIKSKIGMEEVTPMCRAPIFCLSFKGKADVSSYSVLTSIL